jgi:hypothetical protein
LTHAADSESSFFIPTRYLGSYSFSRRSRLVIKLWPVLSRAIQHGGF